MHPGGVAAVRVRESSGIRFASRSIRADSRRARKTGDQEERIIASIENRREVLLRVKRRLA